MARLASTVTSIVPNIPLDNTAARARIGKTVFKRSLDTAAASARTRTRKEVAKPLLDTAAARTRKEVVKPSLDTAAAKARKAAKKNMLLIIIVESS
jgi:hypothetical protein